ncbi:MULTISPECIES: TonB-dependent receptor [Pseudomonas]|uniref:TonB-dependent receptor n=1 Tax=Pseudomonas TaxID=286 RepID=UPI000CDB14E4|nr:MULTISPECIES: TonB-dependent siderophore receptor [Pseudomonas]POR71288.1 ligand-gated channel [Pseudomonas syringae pv. syringae]POR80558.1 ligand-gated channel [Pseudomonas syringae pv. syringae]BBN65312.1 ligand-gated channel [Pseudomonas sp. KUIN-1]
MFRKSSLYVRAGLGFAAFSLALPSFAADVPPAIDDSTLATLPQVTVKATKRKPALHQQTNSGALGSHAVIDTPFSFKSVGSDEIQARQAGILSEAVKYDASVTSISSSYGTHPATLAVRGLPLDDLNGYKVDGMANINRGVEMPLEMFERVDVLKGLSGFMYGFGSPGGIVNYVTKRPTDKTTLSVDAGYQSDNVYKEHLDAGGRLDDPRFGYRVNVVHEEGDAASGDAKVNRTAVGVALNAQLSDDLSVDFDTLYQKRNTSGGTDIIVNTKNAVPSPIDGSKRLYSNGSYTDVDYSLSTVSATYKFSPDWTGKLAYRYSDSTRRYVKDQYQISSDAGAYTDKVTSEYHAYDYNDTMGTLEGKFTTGWFTHDVVLGASYSQLNSDKSVVTPKTTVGKGNLYNPTIFSVYNIDYSGGTYGDDNVKESAVFASDTIGLGEHWSLLAGLRNENYREQTHDSATSAVTPYKARPATPTVALMYKPTQDVTLYASYVESLESGGTAPSSAVNSDQTLSPLLSKQYEVGVKAQQRNWSATAAAFRIDRGAEYTNDANVYVQSGTIRYQGLELNASVDATPDLTVEGSVMSLDSAYHDAGDGVDGNRAAGAAHYQAATQVTYRVPVVPGMFLHTGAQRIGEMAVDSGNVHTLPAYSLFDAGGGYRLRLGDGHALTLGANLTNLANKKYWTYYQENYLQPGSPRTLSLNTRYDF